MGVAAALVAVVVAAGTGATLWLPVRLRLEERLAVGAVLGIAGVSVCSFAYFEVAGMGADTLAFGITIPGAVGASGVLAHRVRLAADARSAWSRLRLPARHAASLRPLLVFSVACGAVATRILALAYQRTDRGISAGHLATWADWAAHLAYSGSFAYGDNRSLEQPLAAGAPFKYHFFANYVGALLTPTGLELTRALVLSSWLLAVTLPVLMWCAVVRLVRSRAVAGVSVLLFTLTGGVGAWYFAMDVREQGWRIVTELPRSYARITEQHLWLDNTIAAALYAQRSTLLGLVFGFAALLLVLASRPAWSRAGFATAGTLVGLTGIGFVHMTVSALALGALAAIRDRRRAWWWFLAPAAVIGLPLVAAIQPDRSSLRWHVGWMAPAADQTWIVFWLRNAGLLLPLFLAIAVLGGVPRRVRVLTAPLWLWFVVPNVVAFHPWDWNNMKFFLFWQCAGSIAVAALLVGAVRRAAAGGFARISLAGAAVATFASLTVTGALDTLRATQRSSAIPWVDAEDVAAATWLREHAVPGERLVYGATNVSAVAAMSGVPAVSGYPGWTADLALDDWDERWAASRAILRGEPDAEQLVARYDVDYVVIGPRERDDVGASDAYWSQHATLVFELGAFRIYRI